MTIWYRLRLFGLTIGELEIESDTDDSIDITYTPREAGDAEHLVWRGDDDTPAADIVVDEHAGDER